ncbi:MAG: hypothetical protein OHK0021_12580 [Bryobacter sp.]
MYQSYLGLAGNPVEWTDRYFISSLQRSREARKEAGEELDFVRYMDRIADTNPRGVALAPGQHPFPAERVSKTVSLTFNVASYSRQLVNDFLIEGGTIERREFRTPGELASLPEKTIVNATGYGARALFGDESLVPVRGQITWLIPQPEINYGVIYKGVLMLGRRDGIVVQSIGSGEMEGYNDPSETPDRAEAESAVKTVAELF